MRLKNKTWTNLQIENHIKSYLFQINTVIFFADHACVILVEQLC